MTSIDTCCGSNDLDEQLYPPWRRFITDEDYCVFETIFGRYCDMTGSFRFNFGLANFYLLETSLIFEGREYDDQISDEVWRSIQTGLFSEFGFCPMLVYNRRFDHGFSFERSTPVLDLTPSSILDDKIIFYREKIDGVRCWSSRVVNLATRVEKQCYVGGISFPLVDGISEFELVSDKAYSISPFNVECELKFPFGTLRFVPRLPVSTVNLDWYDGAIAYLWCDGRLEERRVKSVPSSEVQVTKGFALVDSRLIPVCIQRDGVFEATLFRGELEILAYRPFKTPDPRFLYKMSCPDMLNLSDLPYTLEENSACVTQVVRDLVKYPQTLNLGTQYCLYRKRTIEIFVESDFEFNLILSPDNSCIYLQYYTMTGDLVSDSVRSQRNARFYAYSFSCNLHGLRRLERFIPGSLRYRGIYDNVIRDLSSQQLYSTGLDINLCSTLKLCHSINNDLFTFCERRKFSAPREVSGPDISNRSRKGLKTGSWRKCDSVISKGKNDVNSTYRPWHKKNGNSEHKIELGSDFLSLASQDYKLEMIKEEFVDNLSGEGSPSLPLGSQVIEVDNRRNKS